MENIIQSLLLVLTLAFSVNGHYHHIQYLKRDHSDDVETVPDRPGFTGEWEINGTAPWVFRENGTVNQRNFVESSGGRCAFKQQSQNDEKVFEEAFNRWKAAIKNGKNTGWFNGRRLKMVVIPTYVHVLTDGKKGDVSEQMIDDQIQVLNDAFEEAGFHFLLTKQSGMSASRTSSRKWHQGMYDNTEFSAVMEMKWYFYRVEHARFEPFFQFLHLFTLFLYIYHRQGRIQIQVPSSEGRKKCAQHLRQPG